LPIREFDLRSVGDILSRINGDSSRLRAGLIQATVAITGGLFLIVGASIGMALRDLFLFLLTLAVVAMSLIGVMLMSKIVQRASFKLQRELGQLSGLVERDLRAIRTVRAANATKSEEEKIINQTERLRKLGIKLAKIQALITPISNLSLQICGLLVLGLGGYRVSMGYMTMPDLVAFALMLYIMIGPVGQILGAFTNIGDSLGAFMRIRELLEIEIESDSDLLVEKAVVATQSVQEIPVRFENVSFGYVKPKFGSNAEEQNIDLVLRNVSLSAKRGLRTAIVGPSGAGKSTVLQLIERFYETSEGIIYINGEDHRRYDREELRHFITYVEQNAPILSGTLRENLLIGNPDSTEAECHNVLEQVNLQHLLERDTKGLDMQVGEDGASLSGGERQRLAMARALLSSAEIVLLDETTSNLDSLNEHAIKEAIDRLQGDKTVIVVAHRLSTVINSDVIYVLEHGRVVGVGSHDELLDTVPLYRELAKEQFIHR